ncbi:sensor histidine kinase [Mucilaginibacter sp. RS28]|uniref:Sensor histidine kinase n=1 Tax=Mucilaginibacter straminoryzae TaxID=2932774 RepID=A0A9X1X6T4_9SPHI|nr:sensor histidine kinase [Mucilaginibacter straminoryzae]MCJ8211991.1 sensor histidine kinase [Mucilaginibacter straminoryzae]
MQKIRLFTVAIHLAGWLLFLSFPLVFIQAGEGGLSLFDLLLTRSYWEFSICYFLLFYVNSWVLIPRFFLKKKYVDYGLIVIIFFAGIYFLQPFDRLLRANPMHRPVPGWQIGRGGDIGRPGMQQGWNAPPPPPDDMPFSKDMHQPETARLHQEFGQPPQGEHRRRIDTTSLFIFVMIIALSTAVEVTREWNLTEQRASMAEAGKANAELSFLKAQINPHFLFNTLNNIYTLAVTGNQHTADSIMKLSKIMRYVTDEITEDFVPLENEIECVNNYIDLQRLRIGKRTEIDYSVTGDPLNKVVAPLIFMTFIENVFKYGISKQEQSKLVIRITILEDSINLFCQNPVHPNAANDSRRGIGIQNTKQRLQHLYADKHHLNIVNENQLYTVELNLYS